MAERPLGLISVDELVRVLPDLIADALRERDTRPPPASQATLTKATGVVTTAGTTTAEVQLDDDEPGVISQVQLSAAVQAGDRVVVLLSPGGGAVAIGSGSAQTAVPLLNGPGDPNGVITAPEGWLYEQSDAPDLWQNTDGASAWQLVGTGVSATFPITYDDGTTTYTIDVDTGRLRLRTVLNAGSVLQQEVYLYDDSGFEVGDRQGGGTSFNDYAGGGTFFNDEDGGGVFFNLTAGGGFFVSDDDGGGIYFDTFDGIFGGGFYVNLHDSGVMQITDLPTSNPGGTNNVWNDSGTLKIT